MGLLSSLLPVLLALALSQPIHSRLAPHPSSSHLAPRSTSTNSTCPSSEIVAAWWPAWSTQTPGKIPWASTDFVIYFVVETSELGLFLPTSQSGSDITLFVKKAHAANNKALVSIGGWSGSAYFSSHVATSTSRTAFAKTILTFIETWGFDGVDLDWEYVGRQGIGNNIVSSEDAANFLKFLAVLRTTMGSERILHGIKMTNYTAYAAHLDYIVSVASLSYASSWSTTTGPNAPLAQCNKKSGSVAAAISYWTKAGFPACRILLGVPGYSHIFKTKSQGLKTTIFEKKETLSFQSITNISQPTDETYTYRTLISRGWLSSNGTVGAKGFTRHWDSCTSTPFLFHPSKRIYLSYDDAESVGLKAKWARSHGLAGVHWTDQGSLYCCEGGIERHVQGRLLRRPQIGAA
ncbi:hypothetical protein RQP46_009036 [Phenoliferia psychrophenolica]